MIMTRAVYGSQLGDSVIDADTFEIIKALVLCHPGETRSGLPDIIDFSVPVSSIQRPNASEAYRFLIDSRGHEVHCEAVSSRKLAARFEIERPLSHDAFDHVSVYTQHTEFDSHLLRREQPLYSNFSLLTDRVIHTVKADGKDVTFTIQKRWVYPFKSATGEGLTYFKHFVHEVFFEVEGLISSSALKSIIQFNSPQFMHIVTVYVALGHDHEASQHTQGV
jgi:hypothetical protein